MNQRVRGRRWILELLPVEVIRGKTLPEARPGQLLTEQFSCQWGLSGHQEVSSPAVWERLSLKREASEAGWQLRPH